MPFSQYFGQSALNWLRSQQLDLPPTGLYVSLHTADPGINGVVGDVTTAVAGGRALLPTANLSAPAASALPGGGLQVSNTAAVLMTSNASAPAALTHFGVWTAASGGNFLTYGALAAPVLASTGDVLQFGVGLLVIRSI
jgi:hypothetical protein